MSTIAILAIVLIGVIYTIVVERKRKETFSNFLSVMHKVGNKLESVTDEEIDIIQEKHTKHFERIFANIDANLTNIYLKNDRARIQDLKGVFERIEQDTRLELKGIKPIYSFTISPRYAQFRHKIIRGPKRSPLLILDDIFRKRFLENNFALVATEPYRTFCYLQSLTRFDPKTEADFKILKEITEGRGLEKYVTKPLKMLISLARDQIISPLQKLEGIELKNLPVSKNYYNKTLHDLKNYREEKKKFMKPFYTPDYFDTRSKKEYKKSITERVINAHEKASDIWHEFWDFIPNKLEFNKSEPVIDLFNFLKGKESKKHFQYLTYSTDEIWNVIDAANFTIIKGLNEKYHNSKLNFMMITPDQSMEKADFGLWNENGRKRRMVRSITHFYYLWKIHLASKRSIENRHEYLLECLSDFKDNIDQAVERIRDLDKHTKAEEDIFMEKCIKKLENIPIVIHVYYREDDSECFTFKIAVREDNRDQKNQISNVQVEMHNEFPNIKFDFFVFLLTEVSLKDTVTAEDQKIL
jgi:hypothetical protein